MYDSMDKKKAAKSVISLRLEEDDIAELKDVAAREQRTVTDILYEGVSKRRERVIAEQNAAHYKKEFEKLKEKYMRDTGRRPQTKRRISIPLTDAEYETIRRLAYENDAPKSHVVRQMLITNNKQLQLATAEEEVEPLTALPNIES